MSDNIERVRQMAKHGVDIALLVTGDAFDPGKEPATCAHHVLDGIEKPMENIEIAVGADLYMNRSLGSQNECNPEGHCRLRIYSADFPSADD